MPPSATWKPASSRRSVAWLGDMPPVEGIILGTPSTALASGLTKFSSGSHCWIALKVSPHIGPAVPEPEALKSLVPPTLLPISEDGLPSALAPAIIDAPARVGV